MTRSMPSVQQADIIIIGAGVIGISIALQLQQQGKQVLLLDNQDPNARTSIGNAGAFAFSDIIPLATPGIMAKAPKWLVDPLGPLSIPASYALPILPWMLHFWRASWADRYQSSLTAQASLMQLSKAALDRQVLTTHAEHLIRHEGQLQLYQGQAEFEGSLSGWRTRQEHGVTCELLTNQADIADIQPGLDRSFTHAGFTPEWKNTTHPEAWLNHLSRTFFSGPGQVLHDHALSLALKDNGVHIKGQKNDYFAPQVVVSAGAWSKALAASIGDSLPLETERGYNTTLPAGAFDLRTHLTFSNHGFVVTKVGEQIRVGGAVELGGLALAPNYRRAKLLLDKATQFLPSLNPAGGQQWMGFRPSMPDSLPVISPSGQSKRVVYAFGHGHLGLTQSAGTAELVCDLLLGKSPRIDLAPFSAQRF
ncbi:NAD(P)/FAD-dependent oxidoreductase [Marinomonas gallaica]|uniref:NAD(P)/FAD-dependent oxidoreductase n=1 Tax=Marinomonas gallaica TaxID=1806667 RepID=UPI003A92A192